jgi:catechol 2,3-dioxygenase-like lactoylglutathione lyase family enzyme
MPQSETLQYGHAGLNVTEIARSSRFYQEVLGLQELRVSREAGREFAFLGRDGVPQLTLWKQSEGAFSPATPGLHHLAFRVETIEEVREAEKRVRVAGGRIQHGGIVPHAEGASSGGIFFEDPDGIRLEIYTTAGANEQVAPHSDGAPTCGFF